MYQCCVCSFLCISSLLVVQDKDCWSSSVAYDMSCLFFNVNCVTLS